MLIKTALLTALAATALTVPAAASAQDWGRGVAERPYVGFRPALRPVYFHRAWLRPAYRPFVRYAPYGYRVGPYVHRWHPRPYGY